MALRVAASGIWLATDTADYILFEERSTVYHQMHIIFHELGHLLCGHQPGQQALQAALGISSPALVAANVNLRRVQRLMCRAAYSSMEELEAELFASLLRERIPDAPLATAAPIDPALAQLLHHLAVSLADGEVLG
jgi:hypothetical protein